MNEKRQKVYDMMNNLGKKEKVVINYSADPNPPPYYMVEI